MTDEPGRRRVVIVGGGFAGLFAARALRRANVSITLIDRAQHHLFQPLLYQCATGILSEGKIAAPLRDVLKRHKNVDCVLAEVVDFDAAGRRVIARRIGGDLLEYGYDDLIVAAGVRQSYFGHDEYAGLAPGMKTVSDALAIRRRVYGAFEMADTAADPAERRHWLTFALVGAGPTGVELAGQIRELATKTLRDEFRSIEPSDARVLLFDGGSAPLASFGPKLSQKADHALQALGVEQHMGSIVTHVDRGWLEVRDRAGQQTRYDANTVLWTAGVEAPPVAGALARATGAQQDKAGRILVEKDLTVPGHPEIFVLGDIMCLDDLPGVAEVAMQSGLYAGHRIRRRASGGGGPGGQPDKPFRYRDLGSAAYISRGRAVVSAGPLQVGGFLGWWIWLFIHIAFLTGYRNRVGALVTWWLAFTRDIRRERTFTVQEVKTFRDVYTNPLRYPGEAGGGARAAGGEAGGPRLSPVPGGARPEPGLMDWPDQLLRQKEDSMADLIAIGYPDEATAEAAADEARRLAQDLIIEPDAIAVIVRDKEGKYHVHTSHHPVGAGATWGMFWGLLFGVLFFVPVFGIAIGAGLGALMGKVTKSGIDRQFQDQVRGMLQPGTSALFLMVEKVTPDKAVEAMSKYGGTVLKTSLSKQGEQELQDALHGGSAA